MTYTYEQVLAYEVARELINSHIADCSAVLGEEEEKAEPDHARIEHAHRKMDALFHEREQMELTDDAAISAITAKYRRGARVGPSPQARV